jgi:hypothetical protein
MSCFQKSLLAANCVKSFQVRRLFWKPPPCEYGPLVKAVEYAAEDLPAEQLFQRSQHRIGRAYRR